MNTLSTITILPENKEQMKVYTENIKSEMLSGNYDILKLYKQIRLFTDSISETIEEPEIKKALLAEAEKHGKSFEHVGCTFSIVETPKYDYSVCENVEYAETLAAIKELTEHKKELEKKMENRCNLDALAVDRLTSEILPAPLKKVKSVLRMTIK